MRQVVRRAEQECALVVSENVTVQAMFAVMSPVTVTTAGNGTGTIVSTPAGISCPPTCSKLFPTGQEITFSSSPGPGAVFAGWSGACTGTTPCRASTSAAVNLTARFARPLTCTTVANGSTCGTVARPEINLGMITGTACHDQCQPAMAAAGMTSGCWIVALNGNCYCRDGVFATGSDRPGGVCN